MQGKKLVAHGYFNIAELPKELLVRAGDVHTYYIDLEDDLIAGERLTIIITK